MTDLTRVGRPSKRERAEESWRRQTEATQQWAKPATKLKAAGLAVVFMGVRVIMQFKRRRGHG